MTQDMAVSILADEIPQIRAQAHVGNGALVQTPILDRDTFEENKSLSIEQVFADLIQKSTQFRKGEMGLY